MQEFEIFCASVLDNWIQLAGGCAILVVIGLMEKFYYKREVSTGVYAVLLVALLFWACFQAWEEKLAETVRLKGDITTLNNQISGLNDQINGLNSHLSDLRAEIDSLRKPIFSGHIEHTLFSDLGKEGTQILILATISNTGAPSVAKGFQLSIHGDSFHVPLLMPTTFIKPQPMKDLKTGKVFFTYKREDDLYEKTAKPIERGGSVTGWLLYRIPDVSLAKFSPRIMATLNFHDIFNNRYQASHPIEDIFKGSNDQPRYFPGSQPLLLPEKKSSRK